MLNNNIQWISYTENNLGINFWHIEVCLIFLHYQFYIEINDVDSTSLFIQILPHVVQGKGPVVNERKKYKADHAITTL